MEKLADISQFEALQYRANVGMGVDSVFAVFNDAYVANKTVNDHVTFEAMSEKKKEHLFNLIISQREQQDYFRKIYFLHEGTTAWKQELGVVQKWLTEDKAIKENPNVKRALTDMEIGLRLSIKEAASTEHFLPQLFANRIREREENLRKLGLEGDNNLAKFSLFGNKKIDQIIKTAKRKGEAGGMPTTANELKKDVLSGAYFS
jgi:succinate dehydrogenase flavin-adding protein (antitoxin of CptAB toxin-antitoxin module)